MKTKTILWIIAAVVVLIVAIVLIIQYNRVELTTLGNETNNGNAGASILKYIMA